MGEQENLFKSGKSSTGLLIVINRIMQRANSRGLKTLCRLSFVQIVMEFHENNWSKKKTKSIGMKVGKYLLKQFFYRC